VRRARRDHPALGGGPALVAVLAEEVELLARVPDRVADLVQAAEGQRLPRRAAGDHRDRRDRARELDEYVGGLGVDVGRLGVVHDRRQRAVEVQGDHRGRGRTHQCGVPLLPLA
jgi:hypothetical protein